MAVQPLTASASSALRFSPVDASIAATQQSRPKRWKKGGGRADDIETKGVKWWSENLWQCEGVYMRNDVCHWSVALLLDSQSLCNLIDNFTSHMYRRTLRW